MRALQSHNMAGAAAHVINCRDPSRASVNTLWPKRCGWRDPLTNRGSPPGLAHPSRRLPRRPSDRDARRSDMTTESATNLVRSVFR